MAERQTVLEFLLGQGVAPERIILTITAMASADAVALARHALRLGVRQHMLMPPFYFKHPPAQGVIAALSEVIRGVDDGEQRVLLYHFPAMSNCELTHAVIAELLHRHPQQVVGLKDSSGERERTLELVRAFPQLSIFVGAEPDVAAVLCAGGQGAISGLANIAPRLMRRVVSQPEAVAPQDLRLMSDLLALLHTEPGLPFVGVYKLLLALQTGDDAWRMPRAPLYPLEVAQSAAIERGYRALGAIESLI